ncbi:DNA pilot protein [robinz microvirus RP_165]|nr:DNA pilot protein [robinz microvirus RP_165]
MLGALISAGASLAGGLLGNSAAKRQEKLQREFAQNQLQWKAADAEKAGISKVFAMGAPVSSYSPVSVGGLGTSVADAGQQIGRAMEATTGAKGRAGNLALQIAETQLEGLKVDNEIKRASLLSSISTRNQPGQPPGITDSETIAIPGQGNALLNVPGIKVQKQIAPAGHVPQKSFGVSPEVDMYRTTHGFAPEVPQELGEAQESQPLSAAQWFLRNKIMPQIDDAYATYPYPAPDGSYWQFNPLFGEYTLRKIPSKGKPSWETIMKGLRR